MTSPAIFVIDRLSSGRRKYASGTRTIGRLPIAIPAKAEGTYCKPQLRKKKGSAIPNTPAETTNLQARSFASALKLWPATVAKTSKTGAASPVLKAATPKGPNPSSAMSIAMNAEPQIAPKTRMIIQCARLGVAELFSIDHSVT
jgi:hypothetical protein